MTTVRQVKPKNQREVNTQGNNHKSNASTTLYLFFWGLGRFFLKIEMMNRNFLSTEIFKFFLRILFKPQEMVCLSGWLLQS